MALFAVSLAIAAYVADLLLMFANAARSALQPGLLIQALENLALVVGVAFGYRILKVQPRNRVGWCLIVAGLSFLITSLSAQVADFGYQYWGEVAPTLIAAWVAQWSWIGSQAAGPFLLLYYPTGRLPSSRWKPVLWYFWFVVTSAVVAHAFGMGVMPPTWAPQPVADVSPLVSVSSVGGTFGLASQVLLMSMNVMGALSLVFRYRQGSPTEQSQIRVVALIAILSLVGLISLRPFQVDPSIAALLNIGIVIVLGATIALAVTRHRLFDIDRLVSRTITYALVVAVLGAAFFAIVAVATTVLPSQNSLVVASATLLVAALFNPLRRRVQIRVDRRFNRSHYDAQMVLDDLSSKLADATEAQSLADQLVEAVVEAVEPSAVGIWVARDLEPHDTRESTD